eukprot:9721445-Alexandrium_andersonii.AAC.1
MEASKGKTKTASMRAARKGSQEKKRGGNAAWRQGSTSAKTQQCKDACRQGSVEARANDARRQMHAC